MPSLVVLVGLVVSLSGCTAAAPTREPLDGRV